jgi:arsenite-transporting ATPase
VVETAGVTTFLDQPSRFLFFTGKGGVGKTALACATAVRFADAGKRVLLVSTDPASNLDEMLGVALSNRPTPVPGVANLWALDIDPEKAADDYRERVISPYRDVWTEPQIGELREQLAGACTVEIAAFDEFADLLAGDAASVPFDHVLFDTAPTGHTLRLLSLPRAWTSFLQSTSQGASCLGPHSGLKMQEARFAAAVEALADGRRTIIVLVTRPDRAALREVDRTSGELAAIGLKNQQLAINAVFESTAPGDRVAAALEERGRSALRALPARLQGLPALRVPLRAFNMVGLPALRAFLDDGASAALARVTPPLEMPLLPPLSSLIDEIATPGRGLVMVMGKGGVGKVGADRDAGHASARVSTPLMKVRDPEYTKILLVTLAETTPVSEAAHLQADLRRAQIEPFGWVINSSLAAAGSADPCLRQRIAAELGQIEVVRSQHSKRVAIVPWLTEEPIGPARLLALAQGAAPARDGA